MMYTLCTQQWVGQGQFNTQINDNGSNILD